MERESDDAEYGSDSDSEGELVCGIEDASDYRDSESSGDEPDIDFSDAEDMDKIRVQHSDVAYAARSPLLSLPLDILFEIMFRLKPYHLIRLARVNKHLRGVLLGAHSSAVWRSARLAVDGPPVPDPPEGMSEATLAHLLFGSQVCIICRARDTPFNFGVMHRACGACLGKNTLSFDQCKDDPDLLAGLSLAGRGLLPSGNTWAGPFPSGRKTTKFWIPDVRALQKKMAAVEKQPLADDNPFVEHPFITDRVAYVKAIQANRPRFKKWAESKRPAWRHEQVISISVMNRVFIEERCLEDGHNRLDVFGTYFRDYLKDISERRRVVNAETWEHRRVEIERRLAHSEAQRMYTAQRTRIRQISTFYEEHRKGIFPALWNYLPPHIHDYACFDSLLNMDAIATVEDKLYARAAKDKINQLLVDDMTAMRDKYIALLPGGDYMPAPPIRIVPCSGPEPDLLRASRTAPSVGGPLDLAVSVFEPPGDKHFGGTIIGYELFSLWSQHVLGSDDDVLTFSPRASSAAAALVSHLGMDPARTTAKALDQLDLRFICLNCRSAAGDRARRGLFAYAWQSAVDHHLDAEDSDHPTPLWQVLEREEAADVKRREPTPTRTKWLCNYCTYKNIGCDSPKETLLAHLSDVHAVSKADANEDRDYVHWPQVRWEPPVYSYVRHESVLVIDDDS